MFDIVDRYYNKEHIYSKEDVAKFVIAKKLSAEDYRKITGEEYPA